jgi:hypothetical protein
MPIARNEVSAARRFLLAVWAALLVAACLTTSPPSVLGQGTGASGEQEGGVLPTPPRQSAAWTPPPTKLPATLVSTAEHLFQLGLADPRGCEYREIEVLVGGYAPEWKDSVETTHGWVIPAAPEDPRQFGVCWNGLVYPLLSVGKTADLRADVWAAAKAEPQSNSGITGWYWRGNFEGWHLCNPNEARAVSCESPLPTKVCLVLRLGKIGLAETLWDHWTDVLLEAGQLPDAVSVAQQHVKDPYVTLANCWAWALSDRARAAHLRADDGLALVAAEMLAKVGPALKAEARRRGLLPSREEYAMLCGDFGCGGILADQRRRARERREKTGPAVRADEYPDPAEFWEKFHQELDRCPDKAQRIAFLIRQFEEVSSLQEPGGLPIVANVLFSGALPSPDDPSQHPISVLLAAQGDDAVEPLLACLEKDDRLTRWRPYVATHPVGVRVFANGALERTLKLPLPEIEGQATEPGGGLESEDPEATVARVRAYWQRYKGVPPMERWYRTLADDQARDRWLVAARTIVQPASVPVTLDSVQHGFREDFVPYSPSGERMYGEPLRNRTSPSVTELMVKRVEALDEPINRLLAARRRLEEQEKQLAEREAKLEQQASSAHQLEELDEQQEQLDRRRKELDRQEEELCWRHGAEGCGGDMALCLAKWDPAAAIPVLRRLTLTTDWPSVELRARVHGDWGGSRTRGLDHYYAGLLIARIDVGDLAALDQYAAWIRGVKPEDIEYTTFGYVQPVRRFRHQIRRLLAPLWQHPDHPAIAATTEWLFNGEASPWNPIVSPRKTPEDSISVEPLRGPLMTLPAFRRQVARLLEDRREAGQVEVISNEEIRTGVENGRDPTRSTVPDDPLCPPPGTKAAFRICDVCAYGLSSLDGAPKCELFWPERERDRAVEACAGYLRQYGDHIRLVPQRYAFGNPYHVQLVLPVLDRPATPEDMRRGDAVFSLAGQGTARVCKMPRLPVAARWTTQTDYPVLRDEWDDAAEEYKKITAYEQDGIVWQAEEVRSGGRWQRYYGFVGCHGLAKVPAEEIEFPWTGTYVGVPAPSNVLNPMPLDDALDIGWTGPGPGAVFTIGGPLVCRMLVRNRAGMEQTLPPLTTSGDHAKPAGDAVTIDTQLCWMHPLAYWDWRAAHTPAPWAPLVPKRPERLILKRPERPLGPGEEFEILRCDLNEQFGPLRAGQYGFRTKLISNRETRSQEEPDVFFQLVESEPELSLRETPR